jgi:hypothetical protein
VIWHEGWLSVLDVFEDVDEDFDEAVTNNSVIPAGRRNKTLSHYAAEF